MIVIDDQTVRHKNIWHGDVVRSTVELCDLIESYSPCPLSPGKIDITDKAIRFDDIWLALNPSSEVSKGFISNNPFICHPFAIDPGGALHGSLPAPIRWNDLRLCNFPIFFDWNRPQFPSISERNDSRKPSINHLTGNQTSKWPVGRICD